MKKKTKTGCIFHNSIGFRQEAALDRLRTMRKQFGKKIDPLEECAVELKPKKDKDARAAGEVVKILCDPPKEYSQAPFWFWNGKLDPVALSQQLKEMSRKGVHSVVPHPRFGMDRRLYLEEPYWQAFDACLNEAKDLGSTVILYDEYNWPSGGAGGRVTDGHPEFYPRGLDYLEFDVTGADNGGGGEFVITSDALVPGEPESAEFEAIVAGFLVTDQETINWGNLADDMGKIFGTIPCGRHKVVIFFQTFGHNPSPLDGGSGSFVDYLNPAVTSRFIELTHEQYKLRYHGDFGKTITGLFTDEPQVASSGPFPWTHNFRQEFIFRRGYDIVPNLMSLVNEDKPESYLHRAAYWQTVAELAGDAFYNVVGEWCRSNGIALTGHIYEENISAWTSAPNLMDWLRHFDWPGIDALGPRGSAITSKIAASVAHLYDKEHFACEALGLAHGWNATLEMAKKGYQFLGAMGVDLFIPHAFHQDIENPRVECPPSFFIQNPYWKYYGQLSELVSRLSAFNRCGNHVAPIAVYYPIESLWADGTGGKGRGVRPWQSKSSGNQSARDTIGSFNHIVTSLSAGPYDCDVIDLKALLEAQIDSQTGSLKLGSESFGCVVIPSMKTINPNTLSRLDTFASSGGIVIFCGRLPEQSYPYDHGFRQLMSKLVPDGCLAEPTIIRNHGSGMVIRVPDIDTLSSIISDHIKPVIDFPGGRPSELLVMARQGESFRSWLLVNDGDTPLSFSVRLPKDDRCGKVIVLDTEDGSCSSPIFLSESDGQTFTVRIRESSSVIVIASAELSLSESFGVVDGDGSKGETDNRSIKPQSWSVQVVPHGLDDAWTSRVESEWVSIPVFKMKERLWNSFKGWQQPGYDDTSWETAVCERGGALSEEESVMLRAVLPPGSCAIKMPLPVTGAYVLYINGVFVEKRLGMPPVESELDITEYVMGCNDIIAIEVGSESFLSGLTAPIEVRCKQVQISGPRNWKDLGLEWYSGRVIYECEFHIEDPGEGGPCKSILDLGKVEHYVEVWVNGELCGTCIWPPYRIDIGSHVKTGMNKMVLVVSNSLANRFVWDKWGTRCGASWGVPPKADKSGLIGPVVIHR